MSIETQNKPTHISQHLQDLIDAANNSIKTIKKQILEIYETAKSEGFTPEEARILVVEKVVRFSERYLRKILPDEAKRTYTQDNSELVPKLEDSQEIKENVVNISESVVRDLPEPTQELPRDDFDSSQEVVYDKDLVDRYLKEIARLEEENTRLKMQKVGTFGNKFEFSYSFEMPSGDFVPFIVTVFPDKKDGYIRLDQEEVKRLKVKEARRK